MSVTTLNLSPRHSRQPQTRRCVAHEDAAPARRSQTPLDAARRHSAYRGALGRSILGSPAHSSPAPSEPRRPRPTVLHSRIGGSPSAKCRVHSA
eukprot:8280689-Heterocapsa_arctica.AAC.1